MARTKHSAAAATTAGGDENAATTPPPTPQTKRPRRAEASRSKGSAQLADDALVPHAVDEPVPAPTAETVSVDEARIQELSSTFPSVGSSVYSKYLLPKVDQEELEPSLMEALENWDKDRDCIAITPPAQTAASTLVLVENIPESPTDVLLLEQLVESTAYFPLPPQLAEHHVDSTTGRYTGPKRAVAAELAHVLIQPVMTGQRPIIDPNTSTYVFAAGTVTAYAPNYEPFEYTLPPSTDPATLFSITLNSFKPVEQADPYHGRSSQVLRQGRKGERLNRATGFLHPLPSSDKEISFHSLWVYPDSVHESLPVDVQPFVERQFTTTSDGIFHDGIRPDVLPFVRVVVRPIRGHKYPLPTEPGAKYTYMWSLYLRTDAINAAVESHDRVVLAIIRNLLSLATTDQHWLETLDAADSNHFTPIPSISHPEISSLDDTSLASLSSSPSSVLSDTQRICLSWLLKRELHDDRTIKVSPSNTTINTHLVRFGPNGAYFEPFTSRFFTAAQRDSIRVLAQPEPTISVACTDSILKTSGPFCPHKVGIILALVQSNPLQRPRPIPDLSRDLIPTRATLIVCSQASLAEWAAQAQRVFPRDGQVVVMDSSQDYTAVTLAQVQVADIVLVSDTFVFTIYNRNLRHMVHSEHVSSDSVALLPSFNTCLVNSISPMLQVRPSLLGFMDIADDLPASDTFNSSYGGHDDYMTSQYTHGRSSRSYHDCRPSTTLSELFTQAQRSGTCLTDHAAPKPDPAVHTPLHLLFWHRVVLDGISFATSPSKSTQRRQHYYRNAPSSDFTPLRELAASASVTIVPTPAVSPSTSPCADSNAVNTLLTYRMLGINLPDIPRNDMPMSARTSLLRSVSLSIHSAAQDSPPTFAIPAIAWEVVPVHLGLQESTRAGIVAELVRDSLALSVHAIQHHLVPLSFKHRVSATTDHHSAATSAMYDAFSATNHSEMLFDKEWKQWHHLAAYRAKRRWPLYDDFFGPARPDRVVDPSMVDDWMPTAEYFTIALKSAASFDAQVHTTIRSVISQTATGVLAKMHDSLHTFLTTCPDVATHAKRLESTRTRLTNVRSKLGDSWRLRIGEMGLKRGFTLKEIEAVGMAISKARQADAADPIKSARRWYGYSRKEATEDCKLMLDADSVQGTVIKPLLELRLLLDLGWAMTWAKDSSRLLALALGDVGEDWSLPITLELDDEDSSLPNSSSSHDASARNADPVCPLKVPGHCPKARQHIDEEWAQLLGRRGVLESVHLFCEKLSAQQDDSSDSASQATTTPAFADVFGAKVQAVVAHILQQLDADPSAKFVALTDFPSQIHLLGLALHLVNIQAELVIDGASVHPPILSFKTDPTVRVLIMPFSKCAAGINLSEATHILLLHPFVGRLKSPWNRFGRYCHRNHHPVELPLSLSTAKEAEMNQRRMRIWAEWEMRCIEMAVKGGNQNTVVRIAQFIIQHSIEQEFELDLSTFV